MNTYTHLSPAAARAIARLDPDRPGRRSGDKPDQHLAHLDRLRAQCLAAADLARKIAEDEAEALIREPMTLERIRDAVQAAHDAKVEREEK